MPRRVVLVGFGTPGPVAGLPPDVQQVTVPPAELTGEAVSAAADGAPLDVVVVLGPQVPDPAATVQALDRDRHPLRVLVVETADGPGPAPLAITAGRHVRRLPAGQLDRLPEVVGRLLADLAQERRYVMNQRVLTEQLAAGGVGNLGRQIGERLFGELLTRAPIGALIVDPAGAVLGWNDRAADLLRLAEPESLGVYLPLLFGPAGPLVAAHLGLGRSADRPSAGTDATAIFDRQDADGTARHVRLTGQPVVDPAGAARVLVVVEDVTELVTAQRVMAEQRRHALLAADVAAAMTAVGPLPERLLRCTAALVDRLGVDRAEVWVPAPPNGRLSRVAASAAAAGDTAAGDPVDPVRQRPPDPAPPWLAAVGAGREPVVVAPTGTTPADDRAAGAPAGFAGYPLVSGDELVGVVALFDRWPLPPAARAALSAVARQIAVGIRQDRLHQQVAAVADALQRPLLPPPLPEVAGLELAGRYLPHGDGTRVGGDFYDAFELPDGGHAVALGDVCGKGPEAAAVTGLVRHTLWSAAQHRPAPEEVLPLVNRALLRDGDRRFCTLVYAVRTPRPDGMTELRLACAGHPAPILLRAGAARPIAARGTLLGVTRRPRISAETLILRPGDALVLYSDGFTDGAGSRHSRDPVQLADELADLPLPATGAPGRAAALADGLVAGTLARCGADLRDDLAVLVLAVPFSAG